MFTRRGLLALASNILLAGILITAWGLCWPLLPMPTP